MRICIETAAASFFFKKIKPKWDENEMMIMRFESTLIDLCFLILDPIEWSPTPRQQTLMKALTLITLQKTC